MYRTSITFFLLIAICITPLVVADDLFDFLGDNVDYVNNNIEQVPSFIRTIFGNERINAFVTLKDNTNITVSVETVHAKIKSFKKERIKNPSMNVYLSEKTIEEMLSSQQIDKDLLNALDSGKIRYKTLKTTTAIKIGTAKKIFSVYSWMRKWLN